MPNRPPEERMALSRFDTVFLFFFTMITVVSSLLIAVIGPLRGFLSFLIILITAYPFYVGIWHGIMNDKVAERLFAWDYLLLQFAYLLVAFIASLLFILPPFDTLPTTQLGAILTMSLKVVVLYALFFVFARLMYRTFYAVKRVFRENLPSAKEEISKEYDKAKKSHAKWTSIFQSTTVMIELFAVQEWEVAIGVVLKYPIPYSLEGLPIIVLMFVFTLFSTYMIILPQEQVASKRTPK